MDGPEIAKIATASKDGKMDEAGKIAGQTWGDLLARDVKLIADGVQGIIFLPGWRASRGAKLEATVGILCGHKFGYYKDISDENGERACLYELLLSEVKEQLRVSL